MSASLEYELDGSRKHLELKTDTEYCIGRDPDCAVCLGDLANVSRRHCVVYFNTTINSYALADLYSTAGTGLNGRKIGHMDVPLHNGDKITVGAVSFSFHCDSSCASGESGKDIQGTSAMPRPEPFFRGGQMTAEGQFRYQINELFQGNEKILEQLPSREGTELYLTRSIDGAIHFLKIRTELHRDGLAGRELRKLQAGIPSLTGLIPMCNCGSLDDGACFILSGFQDVPSYAKMISMLSPLPQDHALALIYSVGMILAGARQNNLFHGFLKPSKILYCPREGNYITEMGLSAWRERFYPELAFRHGQWYAAPETTAGQSVWQSDQYALGIMLFQMLTGVLPFRSDAPNELARMHREQTMPLPQERNSQIQTLPAVDAIILRMTMKDPAERYASWEKLLHDLEKANALFKNQGKNNHSTR